VKLHATEHSCLHGQMTGINLNILM